jgi:hypothetical protein
VTTKNLVPHFFAVMRKISREKKKKKLLRICLHTFQENLAFLSWFQNTNLEIKKRKTSYETTTIFSRFSHLKK